MALARFGSKRIDDYAAEADTSTEAIQCHTHYEQTRDALLRSFEWSFARDRAALSAHTDTPDFEWDYKYALPADYLRLVYNYTTDDSQQIGDRPTIEGNFILTNDDEVEIVYIRKVTDPNEFDALFVECLVLSLAKKFVPAIAGTKSKDLADDIKKDLENILSSARTVCRQESNVSGRSDWNWARHSG